MSPIEDLETTPPEAHLEIVQKEISVKLLQGSLLPGNDRRKLRDLLFNKTKLVSDEDYVNILMQSASGRPTSWIDQMKQEIEASQAIYIPETFPQGPAIFIPIRTVEKHANNPFVLTNIVLEELAHGHNTVTNTVPFSTIEDGSLSIFPFPSKLKMVHSMNEALSDLEEGSGNLTVEEISTYRVGFHSYLQTIDRETSKINTLPTTSHQMALEEARSVLIYTLFTAKILGTNSHPSGSLNQQLRSGFTQMPEVPYLQRPRVLPGTLFNILYCNPKTVGDDAKELLKLLHRRTPDEFIEHISGKNPKLVRTFFEIVDLSSQKSNTTDLSNG